MTLIKSTLSSFDCIPAFELSSFSDFCEIYDRVQKHQNSSDVIEVAVEVAAAAVAIAAAMIAMVDGTVAGVISELF